MPEVQTPSSSSHAASAKGQPFSRFLLLGFVLVALLPVSLLGFKIYHVAWDNAWREISEKHQLLAQNLAAPLSIYVNDHRSSLGLLSESIEAIAAQQINSDQEWRPNQLEFIRRAMDGLTGFRSVTLVGTDGLISMSTNPEVPSTISPDVFATEECFVKTRTTDLWALTGTKPSPLTGEPTLILSQPVHDTSGALAYVLLGELRIDLIEELRRKIKFGIGGHSVVVDQKGHVIAHPNADWMSEIKDLSHLAVVKEIMAGKTGVTEFYSPFVKDNMVAGFATVPELGWGIMVPQPKSEVEAYVNKLLYAQLGWAIFGLCLAIIISWLLISWIVNPARELCCAAVKMLDNGLNGELPELSVKAPREIQQLGHAFSEVVTGLQESRKQVDLLNQTLQSRINDATRELRKANAKLEQIAAIDHLTKIPNRRTFENELQESIKARRESDQYICLMLIDIDNFKEINDMYGHAAGDEVLIQMATILNSITRSTDLAARFAGDEFVIRMLCSREMGRERAKNVLKAIQNHEFVFEDEKLTVTTSIGLLNGISDETLDVDILLRRADEALYDAKDFGRNCVVEAGSRLKIVS